MFNPLQKLLLIKNIERIRTQLIAYMAFGLASIGIMATPYAHFGHMGSLLLLTAIVSYYSHLVFKVVIIPNQNNNDKFLLTLPIDYRGMLTAKCMALITGFLLLYTPLTLIAFLFLVNATLWPAVILAFYTIMFAAFIPGFLMIIAIALHRQSPTWTIFGVVASNIMVTVGISSVPKTSGFQQGFSLGTMAEAGAIWPSITNSILLGIAGISLFFIALIVLAIFRKQDFIKHP